MKRFQDFLRLTTQGEGESLSAFGNRLMNANSASVQARIDHYTKTISDVVARENAIFKLAIELYEENQTEFDNYFKNSSGRNEIIVYLIPRLLFKLLNQFRKEVTLLEREEFQFYQSIGICTSDISKRAKVNVSSQLKIKGGIFNRYALLTEKGEKIFLDLLLADALSEIDDSSPFRAGYGFEVGSDGYGGLRLGGRFLDIPGNL